MGTVRNFLLLLTVACVLFGCPRQPIAAFSASPREGTEPLRVNFTDLSTGVGITAWRWDFGDGRTSNARNPQHTYTEPGSYTVSLRVTSARGTDTHEETDFIVVHPRVPCEERTGGAMITFQVVDDLITLWIENDEFIDEALSLEGQGVVRIPNFGQVIAGTDCDEQWSWHVDPNDMEWADFTIELCDGTPSYIEENLDDWIDEVGRWCPWSAAVIAVDDRR